MKLIVSYLILFILIITGGNLMAEAKNNNWDKVFEKMKISKLKKSALKTDTE